MAYSDFIARKIEQTLNYPSRHIVTKDEYNNILNLLINQGDYNSDELTAIVNRLLELDTAVVSDELSGIRLNEDGALEVTRDGETWTATGSAGHLIYDGSNQQAPQRSRLKFTNATVTDDGTFTVITALKGDKGDTGEKGDQGIQGIQGLVGPEGSSIIPAVDANTGLMTFTKGAIGAIPPSVYVKGPQGPQGIQGVTGSTGPQGPAGANGVAGPQGPQGPVGNTGATGPQGPMGPQGLQGPTGAQGPQGPQGVAGVKGADGTSFAILGIYPTLLALQTAHPTGTPGQAYAVGTSISNNVYNWDTNTSNWVNLGALQGPQGPQGIQGVQGNPGADGAPGPNAVTAATTTTFTGLLKGSGTYVGTATAGTDYVAPVAGKGLSTNDYTDADHLVVSNTSGTNSGDETAATIKAKLGIATLSGSNTGDQTGGTPALVFGTANAAGNAGTFLRTNDTIALFDATVPSTQAFGDSASVGVATVAARRDHKHAMPASPTISDTTITTTDVTTNNASTSKHGFLVKATAPAAGLVNVVGIANGETVYTNKSLFDATVPATQAFGDSAATGSATVAARRDHKHAMPASTKDTTAITGILKGNGTAITAAVAGTDFAAVVHNQAESTLTFTDITTGNADATHHGFMPKLSGNNAQTLMGDGSWGTPQAGVPIGGLLTTVNNNPGANYLLCNGSYYDAGTYPALSAVDPKAGTFKSKDLTFAHNIASSSTDTIYHNGYYIFATYGTAGLNIWYATDPNGTWTQYFITNNTYIPQKIKVVNGYAVLMVTGGTDTYVYYSSNGTTWTQNPNPFFQAAGNAGFDIMWDGIRYIVATSNYQLSVAYSSAISGAWTAIGGQQGTSRQSSSVAGIIYAGGYYVFVRSYPGTPSTTYVSYVSTWSTNFATWSEQLISGFYCGYSNITCILYSGGKFILAGATETTTPLVTMYYATTPATWTNVTLPSNSIYNYNNIVLTYNGTTYAIFAQDAGGSWGVWTSTTLTSGWTKAGSITGLAGYYLSLSNNNNYMKVFCDTSYYDVHIYFSSSPTGSYKKLPTQTVTDAYVYVKAQ